MLAKAHDPRPFWAMSRNNSRPCAMLNSMGGLLGNWCDSMMAEFRAAHTGSRCTASNCSPTGLFHGSAYANRLKASY